MDRNEKYLDCTVYGGIEKAGRHGIEYWAAIKLNEKAKNNNRLFTEITFITITDISMKYGDISDSEVIKTLSNMTFSKAKARYALRLFDEDKDYYQEINSKTVKDEILPVDDDYIQKMILTGLANIRKNNPLTYKEESINIEGFCNILAVPEKQYLFNASLLLEDDLIHEGEYGRQYIGNGGIYITSEGIRHLSTLNKITHIKINQQVNENIDIKNDMPSEYQYDVAISFAGEDRNIAQQLADELIKKNIRVFYDDFEKADLWGKNLYEHLSQIYTDAARYCVMLLSKNYSEKSWTNLERQSAQARAFREKNEYILPIRLDDTEIPGIPETIGYVSLKKTSINEIAELISRKLMKLE